MSNTSKSFEKLREQYRALDSADKSLFWVHFLVAPTLIVGSLVSVFGVSALIFIIGFILWKASDA